MPFTGIYGLPGRGKSLLMFQHGLRIADKYQLKLVTNFCLDPLNLAYYCKVNNLRWLWENIPKGIVYYVSANKNFAQFLQIKNAVILLDEMGLYAPSAQSWTLPPEAFNAVANNRKRAQHIIYAAQYPSQVHSSIHQICSDILYAEGVAVWDNELKNERLLFKDVHLFQPSEFEVWFRDPKVRKNPVKVWVLATKHWKGIINCHDAQTFCTYDSFGLLEEQDLQASKFAKKTDFGYYPYIIDSGSSVELSSSDLMEAGYTFSEIEEKLDTYYKADRFKKKRIYEASGNHPFVAWKLQGQIPFPGPHCFQQQTLFLWNLLPAASHRGLKRLDLRITREWMTWQSMDASTKNSYKITWNIFIGVVLWVVSLIVTGFFLPKNFIVFLILTGSCFYFPFRIFK
ncbi:zonular occludens toxin domain-containing protein [Microcoleus sp. herbarium12]|jgi:Zonular occludens toxin (Zot)|uniref:zonular occludens toxin domain-containing protein n=1 Tax=Microcoleus sp. herbarium12 TaxID=3055437 RepID=UPI002FD71449